MSDEKQEGSKPSIFDDLETREEGGRKEAPPAADPRELERLKSENATLEEKYTRERQARREARKELRDLKGQKKETTEETTEKSEEDEKEEILPTLDDKTIDQKLEERMRVKDQERYQASLQSEIRKRVKYREDAELVNHYLEKLVALGETSGDPEKDVEDVLAIVERREQRSMSKSIPSPTGSSRGSLGESNASVSKSALDLRKAMKLPTVKPEQIKELSSDIEI